MVNFAASNGKGAAASATLGRQDCGYESTSNSACPKGIVVPPADCNGQGTCSGTVCTCNTGYTGVDCQLLTCATGKAWFDEPTAANTAHASTAECSNRVSPTTARMMYTLLFCVSPKRLLRMEIECYYSLPAGLVLHGNMCVSLTSMICSTYTMCVATLRGPDALLPVGGQGTCNRATGLCFCHAGFIGAGCSTMSCAEAGVIVAIPGATATASTLCSGRGTCHSIAYYATVAKAEDGTAGGFTYGASNTPATWDSASIMGCNCKAQYYGRMEGNVNQMPFGYDCSKFNCPKGDNPQTEGQVHETQTMKCAATGGTFTITFRDEISDAIQWNANTATIQATLSKMERYDDA